jgi:hypothetical protein
MYLRRALSVVILTSLLMGCAGAAPSPSPSVASGYADWRTATCTAWATLFRVVGNPDTAAWSDDVRALQAAASSLDAATAETLEARILAELETARGSISYAAAWPPASPGMAEMDRFFLATEAWIRAYAEVARGTPDAPDPQAAFEAAGGLDAWRAFGPALMNGVGPYRTGEPTPCEGVPMSF